MDADCSGRIMNRVLTVISVMRMMYCDDYFCYYHPVQSPVINVIIDIMGAEVFFWGDGPEGVFTTCIYPGYLPGKSTYYILIP